MSNNPSRVPARIVITPSTNIFTAWFSEVFVETRNSSHGREQEAAAPFGVEGLDALVQLDGDG